MIGSLTPRQREVIRLKALGLTTKEVAHQLGISEVTTKNHLTGIYIRLGAMTLIEAFVALGWLNVPDEQVAA